MRVTNAIPTVFVGAGHHAAWTLYPCLQHVPQLDLRAVCDLDEEKAGRVARQFGAPHTYTDFRRMLDMEQPAAVICCGGPSLHAAVTAEAIQRKLPLFVEKPPAPTAAEVEALAARAGAVPVQVAFMRRFAPTVAWARKILHKPEFGRTLMLYGREGIWASDARTLVMDSGIHLLDLLRSLGGDVASVHAAMSTDGERRTGVVAILRFRSGIVGHISMNSLEGFSYPNNMVEIHGDRGQFIRIDNWAKATWFRDAGTYAQPPDDPANSSLVYEHPWNVASTNKSAALQGYIGELAHFVECLEQGRRPSPDLWDGAAAMQLVEAVNASARSGHTVEVPILETARPSTTVHT